MYFVQNSELRELTSIMFIILLTYNLTLLQQYTNFLQPVTIRADETQNTSFVEHVPDRNL